jgi:hypothetical protein
MMRIRTRFGVGLACLLASVCSNAPNVDKVPVGQQVQITTSDGGVVTGKLTSRDAQELKIDTGRSTRDIPRAEIADVQVIDGKTPVKLPEVAKFREYTVPEGTTISVRVTAPVSSATSHEGDPVEGVLANPIVVDDATVLPAGSFVAGEVTEAHPSGKVSGLASLALSFKTITANGRDDRYDIAAHWGREAEATRAEDAKKIGIGAGAGAAIGAIVGGGKGAGIGAAIGGGAGTGVVLSTSGKEVTLDRGVVLTVSLAKSVDVRVPLEPER